MSGAAGKSARRNAKHLTRSMIDIFVPALMRAWVVTVVASAAILTAMATEHNWNGAVYWRGLPQAFELIGDEGRPPIIDRWN